MLQSSTGAMDPCSFVPEIQDRRVDEPQEMLEQKTPYGLDIHHFLQVWIVLRANRHASTST